jgi:hypothetical protein
LPWAIFAFPFWKIRTVELRPLASGLNGPQIKANA